MTAGVGQVGSDGSYDGLGDDMPRTSRMLAAHQCPGLLGISAETVRQWARRRKIYSRALDPAGRPLYFEHELAALRDTKRATLARRVTVAPSTVTLSHSTSSTRVSAGRVLSCVPVQEGVITEPHTPPPATPEIVIPVRLDFTQAEQQLGDFCQHVTGTLAAAVATGLGVHSLTVAMVAPQDPPP